MKQLQLRNGDLVLGPGGFATVTGSQKVVQDLGAAVREVLGTDRFHPRWGTVVQEFVGGYQNDESISLIRAEIARVVNNYIAVQTDQIVRDGDNGLRSRFTPSEIVSSIEDIATQQRGDRLLVRVVVRTSSGSSLTIIRSVEV